MCVIFVEYFFCIKGLTKILNSKIHTLCNGITSIQNIINSIKHKHNDDESYFHELSIIFNKLNANNNIKINEISRILNSPSIGNSGIIL